MWLQRKQCYNRYNIVCVEATYHWHSTYWVPQWERLTGRSWQPLVPRCSSIWLQRELFLAMSSTYSCYSQTSCCRSVPLEGRAVPLLRPAIPPWRHHAADMRSILSFSCFKNVIVQNTCMIVIDRCYCNIVALFRTVAQQRVNILTLAPWK